MAIGIGVLASLAIIVIRMAGGLETLELASYDWTLSLRPTLAQPDPRILLIAITEEDIQERRAIGPYQINGWLKFWKPW